MTALGLRTHLLALVLVVLLPALGLGAATAWHMAGNYRAASEERLSDTAAALALAIDREVEAHVATLAALAASPLLDDPEGDLAAFDAHARRASAALRSPVIVVGPDLRERVNTGRPPGSALPVLNATDAARAALRSGRPAVGDLVAGTTPAEPLAGVFVPVVREGRAAALVATRLDPGRLSALLAAGGVHSGDGAFATLTDGRGVVVARSRDAERFVGHPAPDWFAQAAGGRAAGLVRGRTLAGHDAILAFRRLANAPGWTVVLGEPLGDHRARWMRPLALLAAGGAATFLVAVGAAAWLGRRILRPVRALTRRAEATAADGGGGADAAGTGEEERAAGVAEFERLRLSMRGAEAALRERAAEIAAGEARLRAVVDTAVDAIVVIDERGVIQSFNRAAEGIFGHAAAEAVGRNVSMLMQPADAARHDAHLAAYRRTGERRIIGIGREVEGRRKDGSAVPIDLAIAEWRDGDGRRFFTGIMRDISARRADEARRAHLLREVDHRAKNALAVVQSVLRLTPADEPRAYAAAVEARVSALARAHAVLAEGGWAGADLRALAERELAPFAAPRPGVPGGGRGGGTISLDGPPVTLAASAVQPLAMVLHELATNAARHGAFSAPGGSIELRWRAGRRVGEDGLLRLRWTEAGGPLVHGTPARRGFGTRVVEATVRGQLGGSVERRWEPTGLVCDVTLPLARVMADADAPADHVAAPSAA